MEHGFLLPSKQLDDLEVGGNGADKKKKRLEGEEDEPEESFELYEKRIQGFVAVHLASASSSKRDTYKAAQVFEERKQVIHDFMKTTLLTKCKNPNCGAYV